MVHLERRMLIGLISLAVLGVAMIAFATRAGAGAHGRLASPAKSQSVATIATLAVRDVRVAVGAQRSSGGAMPTADVRLAVAKRVGSGWRKRGEMRLRGTYFWHTVNGPRSICRLQIATAGTRASFRPYIVVQLLRSPALGCGDVQRFTLPTR